MPQYDSLLAALTNLTTYCQHMQKLLKHDQEKFGQNNLDSIAESNQHKTLLVDKMNVLLNQFKTNHSFVDLEKLANDTNQPNHKHIQKKLTQFKMEITACYQAVLTNNNIVTANLQQLKTIWDGLIASQTANSIYDCTGNPTK